MSPRGQAVFVMAQAAGFLRSLALSVADAPMTPIARATAQAHARDLDDAWKALEVGEPRPRVVMVGE